MTKTSFDEKQYKNKAMLNEKDISIRWFSGTGAGGQHRNRTQNCCEITHIPTGFKATGQNNRSRVQNQSDAMSELEKRVGESEDAKYHAYVNELRKKAEARGRIRTYDFKQGLAIDHRSGKTAPIGKFLDGKVDLLSFSSTGIKEEDQK